MAESLPVLAPPTVTLTCANCGSVFKRLRYEARKNARKGESTFCSRGCASARQVTHGHSARAAKSRTYVSWRSMLNRCKETAKPHHRRSYFERGITVCAQWVDSFETFLRDMGERPPGMSLDRINNDGNYEPGNCRWATQEQQVRNRRKQPGCNRNRPHVKLTFETAVKIALAVLNGEPPILLAAEYGVNRNTPRNIVSGRSWKDASSEAHRIYAEKQP